MRNWHPPHLPHPFWAHALRWFLKRDYKKMTKKPEIVEKIIEDCTSEDEFSWRYAPLVVKAGGQTLYHVCEEYPGMGYTDPETPMGETLEDLITELENMLLDMKAAAFANHEIVDGAPYDNWRTKQLEQEETVSWDDDTELMEKDDEDE